MLDGERRAQTHTIVVGASDSVGGLAAMRVALTEARRRGADVVAVRSWSNLEWRLAANPAPPITSPQMWEHAECAVLDNGIASDRYLPGRVGPSTLPVRDTSALSREQAACTRLESPSATAPTPWILQTIGRTI